MITMKTKAGQFSKAVGHKVKVERTKKNLTQETLALSSNVSIATLGSIERGDSAPSIETIKQIADALEIDVYKLFIFD